MQKATNKTVGHQKYTVSVRIRPKIKQTEQTVFFSSKGKCVKQIRPKSILTYSFDNVFEQTNDNQFIYGKSIEDKIDLFLNQKMNTTILAYGQTGSGKTHTLFGHKGLGQKGLVHYIVDQVMAYCQEKNLKASCTFLQIYKEKVTDLLNGNEISLREDGKGELILDGTKTQIVKTKQELQCLLMEANKNKIFGKSYINSESSRSHILFKIELQNTFLNILDLCGNEVLTYQFDQKQRSETNSINLSLFTLNSIISDLCQKQEQKFIPFRNSVLTRLVKKSLIDEKKMQVYLFCNISPQKQHQEFSSSTLRFGQLAIQIDEKDNIKEEKINLSQQKRQAKKIENVIEVDAKMTDRFYQLPQPWQRAKCTILKKKTIIYKLQRQNAEINVLLLHAYGQGCDGTDWNNYAAYLIRFLNCNLYSVDFPGFGKSKGQKFTSRAQKFHEKDQPIEFMTQLFAEFKFNKNNPVFLLGYDLGGAIALRLGAQNKLSKSISGIITLHPTWTDKIEKLSVIQNPTLLLWFPIQNFHLISAGQKMVKVIKNCVLYKFNVGPYTHEKAAGYYDRFHPEICEKIIQFIQKQSVSAQQDQKSELFRSTRGKIMQEKIEFNINKQEQRMNKTRQAVQQYYQYLKNKQEGIIFDSIIKGGQNKPKFIKLVSNLPSLTLENISIELLKKYQILNIQSQNFQEKVVNQTPFLTPGRQIHIKQKINLSVLQGPQAYLAYDSKNGQMGITHKAWISTDLKSEQIFQSGKVPVEIQTIQGEKKQILVQLDNIVELNSPTNFKKNILGHIVLQDNVTCNYESLVMKLMLIKICFKLNELIQNQKPNPNEQALWLSFQHKATEIIFKQMDLRHLVHEGIDNKRYTGTDVGRLAYFGQGNCHHLASTLAALLLPFGKIFGWDVIFRAGSFFIQGRQIDQNGNPLEKWNGKPNVNVEDHTWLQIVYKPSNKIYFFDPSFSLCNYPLDSVYSLKGKMHISGKPLNFAYPSVGPDKLL